MDEHNHEREVTDPVCGMRIAPDAEIQFEHRGVIYRSNCSVRNRAGATDSRCRDRLRRGFTRRFTTSRSGPVFEARKI